MAYVTNQRCSAINTPGWRNFARQVTFVICRWKVCLSLALNKGVQEGEYQLFGEEEKDGG